jgi:hypothetical protein
VSMWKALGIPEAEAITDMDDFDFIRIADQVKEANHDAR